MTKVFVKVTGRYNDSDGKARNHLKGDVLDTSDWYAESLIDSNLAASGASNAKKIVVPNELNYNLTFIEFLNTAEKKELTKLNKIGNSLAEKIIEMRPIVELSEVSEIKGVSEKTLIKLSGLFAEESEEDAAADAVSENILTPDGKEADNMDMNIIAKLQEQIGEDNTEKDKKKTKRTITFSRNPFIG